MPNRPKGATQEIITEWEFGDRGWSMDVWLIQRPKDDNGAYHTTEWDVLSAETGKQIGTVWSENNESHVPMGRLRRVLGYPTRYKWSLRDDCYSEGWQPELEKRRYALRELVKAVLEAPEGGPDDQ